MDFSTGLCKRKGLLIEEPYPTANLSFLWLGGYSGNDLENVLGANPPDVGEDGGDRIYDFSVLNDPRLDKSNATYWGASLDAWFYNNPEHPYWYKLKDFHYREFQKQMASDNNYCFATLIYESTILQSVNEIKIYLNEQSDINLVKLLNNIQYNSIEYRYNNEFDFDFIQIEAFYYNLNLSGNIISDRSLNSFNASLLSGCFAGDNTGYYHKASSINLGTQFTIEWYANIMATNNNSLFIGNSSTINTGRLLFGNLALTIRNNSTNLNWLSVRTLGIHKYKLTRNVTSCQLWIDDVDKGVQTNASFTGDFIFDNIGNDNGTIKLQDNMWDIKIWNGSGTLIYQIPLEPNSGILQYDVITNDAWTLTDGSSDNFGTQATSKYIATYGCTKVVKSDGLEYEIVPYTTLGVPIYNHSTPIWDANETYTEHVPNGSNAIPGTYIQLPEESNLIASCATMILQDWFDESDNAIPVRVEDINPLEEKKQYFDNTNYKNLIIIKLADQ